MSHLAALPFWAAVPVAILVLFGAGLTLTGAIGLVRLPHFYDRLHAPTLGTSWGTAAIVLASILMFSVAGGRPAVHEAAVAAFVILTAPVTWLLLARAALHRDRMKDGVSSGRTLASGPRPAAAGPGTAAQEPPGEGGAGGAG